MDRLTQIARFILDEAKKQGADYAQCTVNESEKKEFNVDGGKFSLMRTLFNRNVVVTVLKDKRKGLVQVNRFDEEALLSAVSDAIAASESGKPDPAWEFAAGPVDESYEEGAPECDTEKLFFRTKELLETIREKHPAILMEQMITEHNSARNVFMSTNGVCYRTRSGAYGFSLMYSAHEGEKSSSFYGSDVTLKSLDKPVIGCALIERELSAVERQLDPKALEGKFTGPVILAPMALGEIVLGTILGNFVDDASLIDGTSIWKNSLGERVADERFTLAFDREREDVVIGGHYTGEGYRAESFDLIRNGVLESFALTQYGANKTGGKRCGNQSGNMRVNPGDKTLDELVSGIDRGLLVMRFSGGAPAPSGEFSGVAKNSFLIENGKITDALTETMISGCVPEMLKNVRGISSDLLQDGNVSLPYVAFDGVTISGK